MARVSKKAAAAPVDAKGKALDTAISQIEKKYGAGTIMRLGEGNSLEVSAVSTGSLTLDLALGVGQKNIDIANHRMMDKEIQLFLQINTTLKIKCQHREGFSGIHSHPLQLTRRPSLASVTFCGAFSSNHF